jgi:hypothetical protein
MRFICAECGSEHDIDDISFGAHEPLQWVLLTDAERSSSVLGDEQCEIDSAEGRSFYIRACLEIPIRSTDQRFNWGVWCSLSEKSYQEVLKHWDKPSRVNIGPHFGWLCTNIPGYPDTAYLKTMVRQRAIGLQPLVELEPTDHPLVVDQREGIDESRLKEIIVGLLHP